jgi:hypothetical protein
MPRTTWTDERLDDLVRNFDHRFDLLHAETGALRRDMTAGFADLRGEIAALNERITTVLLGLCVALIGAVGALIAAVAF